MPTKIRQQDNELTEDGLHREEEDGETEKRRREQEVGEEQDVKQDEDHHILDKHGKRKR